MISAIVTLSPDTADLGGLRRMVLEAQRLGVPGDTPLLDGGHVHPEGRDEVTVGAHSNTFAAVIAFAEALADEDDGLVLVHGADLAIDVPVWSVSLIFCGEHAGATPENIFVAVNPACQDC
jgi:hypothetical protein